MEQEQERGITITSAATTAFWKGMAGDRAEHRINIDTSKPRRFYDWSAPVLGACMTVIAQWAAFSPSRKPCGAANKYKVPRLAFINKRWTEPARTSSASMTSLSCV